MTPRERAERNIDWALTRAAFYTSTSARLWFRDEAESAALVGFWQACLAYDPANRAEFTTFATACIRREIINAWRRWVHHRRVSPRPGAEPLADTQPDPARGFQEAVDARLDLPILTRGLTPTQHAIILALYGHGDLVKDVAVRRGIGRGTVSGHRTEALAACRAVARFPKEPRSPAPCSTPPPSSASA